MTQKIDTSDYQSFDDITSRLDEIVSTVRAKDTSLERSLDLFDEAIALGSAAVDMVDKIDFSDEEAARIAGQAQADEEAASSEADAAAPEDPADNADAAEAAADTPDA